MTNLSCGRLLTTNTARLPPAAGRLLYLREVSIPARKRAASAVDPRPPAGAAIYYYLKSAPKGELTIEILDAQGKSVRRYSSAKFARVDQQPQEPEAEKPRKQIEPAAGLNRFLWDLRYEAVPQVPAYSLFLYARGEAGPLALPAGTR